MIIVLEQSSGERSSSFLDKYLEREHLLHPLFYITTSCSIYTNKHNYNQLSNIEHMYIYLELLIPLSHHQIPLWHTMNIPIFLHHPPSAPRSLGKITSTERFALFQRLEGPKLLFPTCSFHVLQGPYLPLQYVGSWIGQDHLD